MDIRTFARSVLRSLACLAVIMPVCVAATVSPGSAQEAVGKDRAVLPFDPRQSEEFRRVLALEFVRIPGGEFDMGTNSGHSDERPMHRVRVSTFRMGKCEVTQRQWKLVMGDNPTAFPECAECPVDSVSWEEVQEFIRKASQMTGLPLRLPTEAEWEYAARGGSAQQQWAGTNDLAELGGCAWFSENSGGRTHPVCQKRPNLFGLCDMTGNLWEYVSDWKGEYAPGFAENPTGPATGTEKVSRGYGWGMESDKTATWRFGYWTDEKYNYLGFRLALPEEPR